MITLAFYKGWNGPLSHIIVEMTIRVWTVGPYSHCEFIEGRAELNQPALCLSASPRRGIVREKEIFLHGDRWDLLYLNCTSKEVRRYMRSRLDCRYDWNGILFSQILPLGMHSQNAYFCSELIAEAFKLPNPQKYSPNALYKWARLFAPRASRAPLGERPMAR